jgi:hypothetical protein
MTRMIGTSLTVGDLPTGTRVVIRSRTDWRTGAIARSNDEKVTVSVASPSGRNYRIRLEKSIRVNTREPIYIIPKGSDVDWLSVFCEYDDRP